MTSPIARELTHVIVPGFVIGLHHYVLLSPAKLTLYGIYWDVGELGNSLWVPKIVYGSN